MKQVTSSVQDYLKAIYRLQQGDEEVTTARLADELRVAAASVSGMVKKLASRDLLVHSPYRGVRLTDSGEGVALEVIRRHRLLEMYLHTKLGFAWDEVHAEAEVLEHAMSDTLIERIDVALGRPTHDPHGDPIPPKRGRHREVSHVSIGETAVGSRVRIERVSDRDPDALRYLADLGLVPGAEITVVERAPFGGPLWVRVGQHRHPLGEQLVRAVFVSTLREARV